MSDTENKQEAPVTDVTPDTPTTQPDTPQGKDGGKDETYLTQEEVNAIVGKTRKEARQAAQNALLEELGLESTDTLKALVKAEKERQEAEMTEAQKLQKQLEKERQEREAQVKAYQDLQLQIIQRDRQRILTDALRTNGAQDIDELLILIENKQGDAVAALFDEGGSDVDEKKLQAFIKTAQSTFSRYFATAGAGSPSTANGVAPTPTKEKQMRHTRGASNITRQF